MTFNAKGFQTLGVMGTPDGTSGSRRTIHTYITNDGAAQVETSDYFLSIYKRLKVGDLLLASIDVDGTPMQRSYVVSAAAVGGVTITRETDEMDAGDGARAVVPTADGTGTGLIAATDRMVEATSADASHILQLPEASADTRGREIWIWVAPSTNCELQSFGGSGDTINNVDCSGGSVEALLTHSQLYVCRQHLATGWLLQAFTALGAVATAIVPD